MVVSVGLWVIWLTRNSVVFPGQDGFIRNLGRFIVGASIEETKTGESNGTCKDEIVSEIGKKMKEGHVLLKLQKTHNAH
ncbi:hypothetical protein QJS10_CPA01g02929 [Acorus calamus]|uniref:Uncharacterized protein n=1 Tax=Acorus calamus TaxID=4465 RepID=A0AAV9FHX4_ACOCL|nr:hypothetical protein QJS10_CPA01g02929 [Acorus calamus]